MKLDFTGKTVLVTGAASGIGNAVARLLKECGAELFLLDLEPERVQAASSELQCEGVACDLTDIPALERAVASLPDFDVLMANAGIAAQAPLWSTGTDLWNRTLAVNLGGVFHSLRLTSAGMKRKGGGAIVVTASTNSFDGEQNLIAYNASKAGLLGVMRTAANELGPYGIRVNAICPGLIRTRLTEGHFTNPEILKPYFAQLPLGRGGLPQEVAAAAVFLASNLASYITGATLFVDGGQMCTKFATWADEGGEFEGDHWRLPSA